MREFIATNFTPYVGGGAGYYLLDTNRDGRLGVRELNQAPKLLARFDPSALPRTPWVVA